MGLKISRRFSGSREMKKGVAQATNPTVNGLKSTHLLREDRRRSLALVCWFTGVGSAGCWSPVVRGSLGLSHRSAESERVACPFSGAPRKVRALVPRCVGDAGTKRRVRAGVAPPLMAITQSVATPKRSNVIYTGERRARGVRARRDSEGWGSRAQVAAALSLARALYPFSLLL